MANETLGETANDPVSESGNDVVLSIRLPQDLVTMADAAGKALNLRRADVIRLSLGRGIDRLLEQLEAKAEVAQ